MTSSNILNGPFLPPKSGEAKQIIMLLHGYGADGEDLLSIGRELQDMFPDTVFVSPNAPESCGMVGGYQWFQIRETDGSLVKETDLTERVKEPASILNSFIDAQLKKWGVDESQMIVMGFSQGSMMALYTMPRREKPCAGIISYSGLLIDAKGLEAPEIVKPPVLAVHGEADELVPSSNLEEIKKSLSSAGFNNVETVMCPGLGHGINQSGLARGVQFIKNVFENKPSTAMPSCKVGC